MNKEYRVEYEYKSCGDIHHAYDLISADSEHAARCEFPKRHIKLRFKILAVDELDPKTIRVRIEGAHLGVIPVLQRLRLKSVVVRPLNTAACEWGWEKKVWRDAEGHHLDSISKVTGCRGYMEHPPKGGPYYLVETADDYRGIYQGCYLCQEHLKNSFPQWEKAIPKAYKIHVSPEKRGKKRIKARRK
jgi:hypothetical protein